MKQVFLTKTVTSETLTVEGLGAISKEDAIQIAAHIVFLVSGNLIERMENGKIVKWNTSSAFFCEYRKLMEVAE